MSQPQVPIRVVAGLMQHDGAVLICQRCREGAFPLQWEFPGGKVEPGETEVDSLRRELREELGIEARIGEALYRTRHVYPETYTVELAFFHVLAFRGCLQNLAFERIEWEEPGRLQTYDFLEGDTELIALLCQGQLQLPATALPSAGA